MPLVGGHGELYDEFRDKETEDQPLDDPEQPIGCRGDVEYQRADGGGQCNQCQKTHQRFV